MKVELNSKLLVCFNGNNIKESKPLFNKICNLEIVKGNILGKDIYQLMIFDENCEVLLTLNFDKNNFKKLTGLNINS